MNNEELEHLLKSRHIKSCDDDFIHNIKLQAKNRPQKLSLWKELKQAWHSSFNLKPIYALSSVIALGFVVGFGSAIIQETPVNTVIIDTNSDHLFIYQNGYQL